MTRSRGSRYSEVSLVASAEAVTPSWLSKLSISEGVAGAVNPALLLKPSVGPRSCPRRCFPPSVFARALALPAAAASAFAFGSRSLGLCLWRHAGRASCRAPRGHRRGLGGPKRTLWPSSSALRQARAPSHSLPGKGCLGQCLWQPLLWPLPPEACRNALSEDHGWSRPLHSEGSWLVTLQICKYV